MDRGNEDGEDSRVVVVDTASCPIAMEEEDRHSVPDHRNAEACCDEDTDDPGSPFLVSPKMEEVVRRNRAVGKEVRHHDDEAAAAEALLSVVDTLRRLATCSSVVDRLGTPAEEAHDAQSLRPMIPEARAAPVLVQYVQHSNRLWRRQPQRRQPKTGSRLLLGGCCCWALGCSRQQPAIDSFHHDDWWLWGAEVPLRVLFHSYS